MKLLHEQQLLPVEILETISLRYGTPAFIAFESLFQKNCQDFLHDFRCGTRKVTSAYSYKTNNLKAFCRIAHQEGLCAEVVSSSELDMALSLGLEGTQVYYNGPYKSEASLRKAVSHSVAIHVDSIEELDSIDTIARSLNSVARVALRLTPQISDQRGLIWSKFGLSDENGEYDAALTKIARAPRLELEGLHMHIGTNLTDPIAYELAAERLAAFAIKAECQLGHALKYIDVGGGFSAGSNAIPLVGHPEEWIPVSIAAVSTRIAAVLDRVDPERRWSIVVEPGRVIAESAMVLLSRVVSVKERGGSRLAIIDAGTNILPTAYYTHHPITFPGKKVSATDSAGDFYGPLCTQYDVIATEAKAPELSAGNMVLIHSTGAYAWAFSSQFVGPRPPVVLLNNSGEFSLVRSVEPDSILWQYDD